MSNIVLASRGNSFDARYSGGYPTGNQWVAPGAAISTAAGGLSGTVWDLTGTGSVKFVSYSAMYNTPNSRNHSILIRMAPNYSGTPAASRGIFTLAVGGGLTNCFLELYHAVTTGNLQITSRNELGNGIAATASFGAWSPVAGQFYDIVLTWDGTGVAGAFNLYVDGVLLGTIAGQNSGLTTSWNNTYWKTISVGFAYNATISSFKLDEFVIWDGIINPTSVLLNSGPGSLNGSSRTSLVDAAAFNGSSYSDPGIANVRSPNPYTYAGNDQIGTCAVPSPDVVLSGNPVDATTGSIVVASTSSVANSIWDALTSGHTTSGTFGKLVQQILTVAKFLGLK